MKEINEKLIINNLIKNNIEKVIKNNLSLELNIKNNIKFNIVKINEGLTNQLFLVKNLNLLIRIDGEGTNELIDRNNEIKIINELYNLKLAPKIYLKFNNGIIYDYFKGSN